MTLEEQARELRRLRVDYYEKRCAAEAAKRIYDEAHLALWERMDGSGVDSLRIDGTLYSKVAAQPYGTVADRVALYRWAVDEGNAPELFDSKPREKLINELVRQRIDNGEPMPPGVNWYTKQTVAQRKS